MFPLKGFRVTRLLNAPSMFIEHTLKGFVDAHSDLVTAVCGGVVRADEPQPRKVAVVIGVGSATIQRSPDQLDRGLLMALWLATRLRHRRRKIPTTWPGRRSH